MPESISTRRSASEIIHDILVLCSDGAMNKTAIMYQCNLSYDQVKRYLESLCLHGLLQKNQRGRFLLAPEGENILDSLKDLVSILQQLHEQGQEEVSREGKSAARASVNHVAQNSLAR